MSMLRYLAVISTLLSLPVLCLAQTASSPVPAFAPGYQGGSHPMMPAAYGPNAAPMAGPMAPHAPMAGPMAGPTPSMGVSNTFSDYGAMGASAESYDAGSSYFDAGNCGSGNCGSSALGSGSCDSGGGCSPGGGRYMSIFGGLADLDQQQSTGFDRNLVAQFEEGYGLGAAFGRRIGRFFRSELEYTYRSQDPGSIVFNNVLYNNASGNQNAHSGMYNLFFDMIIGYGNLVPYIGGGIGVGFIDSNVEFGAGELDGDDTALALQWMAGLSYRARPNMELFVEYRFFEMEDPKLNYFGNPMIDVRTPNILLNTEYQSTDIFAGFRFNF